jgi:hypothetical protein
MTSKEDAHVHLPHRTQPSASRIGQYGLAILFFTRQPQFNNSPMAES